MSQSTLNVLILINVITFFVFLWNVIKLRRLQRWYDERQTDR